MNILVSGSSGMVGVALVKALRSDGHFVFGLDVIDGQHGTTNILHDLRSAPPSSLLENTDIDLVVHLAANARVYELVLDPERALHNILMTHNVLEWYRLHEQNAKKRFLFASSRETYGNQMKLPVSEEKSSQRNAESAYSASKIASEAWCYAYEACYDINFRIVRLSNVYGKYDFSDRFIPKLIRTLQRDELFVVYGRKKTLDFTYLDDCVSGFLKAIAQWDEVPAELNIASGTQTSLEHVARRAKELMRSNSAIVFADTLPGEVWNYQADISALMELGWKPSVCLEEGLKRSIAYYCDRVARAVS